MNKKLSGFSKYDFYFRGDSLCVRNISTKKVITPSRDDYHYRRKYTLVDDNGNKTSVQELRIAYCLQNHLDLSQIKGKAVAGTVTQPRLKAAPIKVTTDKAIQKLADMEFAIEKMRDFYMNGDISFFVKYAEDSRYNAVRTVNELTNAPIGKLINIYDSAVDLFISKIEACNFSSLKPLFGMLCECLKISYFKNKLNKHYRLKERLLKSL